MQRLPEFKHYLTSKHHEHQRTRICNRATVDYTAAIDHSRAVLNNSTTGWCSKQDFHLRSSSLNVK